MESDNPLSLGFRLDDITVLPHEPDPYDLGKPANHPSPTHPRMPAEFDRHLPKVDVIVISVGSFHRFWSLHGSKGVRQPDESRIPPDDIRSCSTIPIGRPVQSLVANAFTHPSNRHRWNAHENRLAYLNDAAVWNFMNTTLEFRSSSRREEVSSTVFRTAAFPESQLRPAETIDCAAPVGRPRNS